MSWQYRPHSGGVKIPEHVRERVRRRIEKYAHEHYAGKFTRLDIRFRGVFCYIDAYQEPHLSPGWPPDGYPETREEMIERLRNTPVHLVRMRHFSEDRWSVAFYTYSHERYEPCILPNGTWVGTPEEAFEVGGVYLQN